MKYGGELQIETQDNLSGVQSQMKSITQNRKFFAGETTPNVRKQRMMMLNLKSESEGLQETLGKLNLQAQTTKMQATSFIGFDSGSPMMRNKYEDLIEHEKQKLVEIEKNIAIIQSTLRAQNHAARGLNGEMEGPASLNTQIQMLESRLDQANHKFNEAISVNKGLRHTIDGLRKERVIFDNLYKKLEREIEEKRKNMASLIESANDAFEERDRAYDMMDNEKEKSRKSVTDSEKDSPELPPKYNKTLSNVEVIQAISKYERDLAMIQAATKIKDIDEFIKAASINEENNYNIFREVNELSNEVDGLEKAITDLKKEKIKVKSQPVKSPEERLKEMRALEKNLSKLEDQLGRYEVKNQESDKIMESVFNCIEKLYKLLDCEKVFTEKIDSQGVTEENMMVLFNALEERADQIVSAYLRKKTVEESYKTPIEYLTNSVVKKSKYEIPVFEGFTEEDDGDGVAFKPFTMDEFLAQATNMIDDKSSPIKSKEEGKKR